MKIQINYLIVSLIGLNMLFSCQENEKKAVIAEGKTEDSDLAIPRYHTTDQALYDTIVALDEKFWKAYNTGDLDILENITSENYEFYHDRGGVTKTKEEMMKLVKKSLEERPEELKGGSIKNLTEVYKIPGFGALQVGYQQFFTKESPEGTPPSRSITLWNQTEDGWKQEYVFSMHAHPADNFENLEIKDIETNQNVVMKENFKYGFLNDMMKAERIDTSNVTSTHYIMIHQANNTIDTILSAGTLYKINSDMWLQSSENLVQKYQKDSSEE